MFSKDWPTAPLLMRAGHLHKCFVIINITQCPITGTETGPRSFVLGPWSWFMCCFGPSLLDPWLLVQCLGTGCGRSGQADISKNVALTFVSCLRYGHESYLYIILFIFHKCPSFSNWNLVLSYISDLRSVCYQWYLDLIYILFDWPIHSFI